MADLAETRRKLKVWESKFVAVNGKKPGKTDIDAAPQDIQDTYRIYAKLKKEQSVGKIGTNQQDTHIDYTNTERRGSNKEGINSVEDEENQCKKENSPSSETAEEAKCEVWGAQFDRNPTTCPVKKQQVEKERANTSYLKSLSDKMFKKSLFLKGNQTLDISSKLKKPDTPCPEKVVSRNPFGTALKNPFPCGDMEETELDDNFEGEIKDVYHGAVETTADSIDAITDKQDFVLPASNQTCQQTSSIFSKSIKITKKPISSGTSDDATLYIGKHQTNKQKKPLLPKGLSALVNKHKEQTDSVSWEPDFDDVDEDDGGEDRSIPNDPPEARSHTWDVPVKSLIIDDMKNTNVPKHKRRTAESTSKAKTSKSMKSQNMANARDEVKKVVNSESTVIENEVKDSFDFSDESDFGNNEETKVKRSIRRRETKRTKSEHDKKEQNKSVNHRNASGKTGVKHNLDGEVENDMSPITNRESPEMSVDNCEDPEYNVVSDGEVEDEPQVGGKRKKGKSKVPAAKKRKIDKTVAEQEDDDGDIVGKAPVKRAASREKPVSNDNFVRLNMKVKTYQRKGRHMTGQQYKRKMWKEKMQARSKSYGNACFKCGQSGHWANKCPGNQGANKYAKEPVLDDDFPDLQEAVSIARGVKTDKPKVNEQQYTTQIKPECSTEAASAGMPVAMDEDDDVDLDLQSAVVRTRRDTTSAPPAMEPLIQCGEDETLPETPEFVRAGLRKFGYETFRHGQEEAVMRILCGLSTLVVLSTGGGKSLCYQLPAYLYAQSVSCFTLVISPLVSLMEDQITGLPNGIVGMCLHTNMLPIQREKVLTAVKEGRAQFLLVSPEAIAGGSMSLLTAMSSLPPVAFVCIDESHCLSEWSHNFRPSYLRLCKVLQDKLGIRCFLGLTATATLSTATDVSRHLKINNFQKAMVRGSPVPKNLFLSVSRDENREQALIGLLQGERFCNFDSIIIYCTRREQTEKVATVIRTCMNKGPPRQAGKGRSRKGPKLEWDAESYHAGLTPAKRKSVQNAFMSGRLRVVVATVAFGMGLDKADVRGVIHFNMPKSFESYVQEIGRAGRDGEPAQCHLFLDSEGKDLCELRRHTYANTVDYRTLKKLVQKVFPSCRCLDVYKRHADAVKEAGNFQDDDFDIYSEEPKEGVRERVCPGHERSLPIEQTVMELDVKEEGLSTLLCYLELHDSQWLENLPNVYHNCKIQCYGGPGQLQAVAKKCPPVAVAVAKARSQGKTFNNTNTVEFAVVEISDMMGWDSGPVKKELKLLQWNFNEAGLAPSRSGILVELTDLAFHFRSPGDFNLEELDDILQFLHNRVKRQEKQELCSLAKLHNTLKSVSHKNYWMCADSIDNAKNEKLKAVLNEYFDSQNMEAGHDSLVEEDKQVSDVTLGQVISDVRHFHGLYGQEHTLNGRAIARIFHGIASPCYPATTWGRVRRFWRCHLDVDFNQVVKLATKELISMRQ